MTQLIRFPLASGGWIVAEVEAPEGTVRVGRPGEVVDQAEQTFEDAMKTIRPVADSLLDRVKELAEPPDQIGVEFGLKLSAKVGAVIAAAGTEGTFKVTLSWSRQPRLPG